jgi:amino acid transporter
LFAFVLVCAGVLVLQNKKDIPRGKFKTPYINAKFILPVLILIGLVIAFGYNKKSTLDFITNETQVNAPETIITALNKEETQKVYNYLVASNENPTTLDAEQLLSNYNEDEAKYAQVVAGLPIPESLKYESGFNLFKHKIPMWIFLITLLGLTVWSYKENLSLIPLLGLICCLYMMAELSVWNWIYFGIWLLIGLLIYFGFSKKNSTLNLKEN